MGSVQRLVVEPGAVAAPEVFQRGDAPLDRDARVAAGNPRAVDADDGLLVAADQILSFGERDLAVVPDQTELVSASGDGRPPVGIGAAGKRVGSCAHGSKKPSFSALAFERAP